jgi:hypothetical protein
MGDVSDAWSLAADGEESIARIARKWNIDTKKLLAALENNSVQFIDFSQMAPKKMNIANAIRFTPQYDATGRHFKLETLTPNRMRVRFGNLYRQKENGSYNVEGDTNQSYVTEKNLGRFSKRAPSTAANNSALTVILRIARKWDVDLQELIEAINQREAVFLAVLSKGGQGKDSEVLYEPDPENEKKFTITGYDIEGRAVQRQEYEEGEKGLFRAQNLSPHIRQEPEIHDKALS